MPSAASTGFYLFIGFQEVQAQQRYGGMMEALVQLLNGDLDLLHRRGLLASQQSSEADLVADLVHAFVVSCRSAR